MDEYNKQLGEIKKENPFKVPDGYFENLTSQIMSNLPETKPATKAATIWGRVKPWAYVAAMFAVVALAANVFIGSQGRSSETNTLDLTSAAEIEDFYNYYEDQYTEDEFRESLYAGDYLSDYN